MSGVLHLHDELVNNPERFTVETAFGRVIGGRAKNGSAIFLGMVLLSQRRVTAENATIPSEIPYALPPRRFEDPVALPINYRYNEHKEYIRETACLYSSFGVITNGS